MKKKMLEFYKKQLNSYKKQVRSNTLSQEDADNAYAMIDELEALIKELEAAPEDFTMEDVLAKVDEKIADVKEAIKEKRDAGSGDEPGAPAENYLRSTNSLHDFANALRSGLNGGSFKGEWSKALSTNGITITSGDEFGYLPDYVVSRISDLWQHKFEWLNSLKRVNAKRYAIRYQSTAQDSTSPDVRAKGHTAGNAKTDNAYTFLAESLECQAIYARIKVDNSTIFNDDKGLVDYVIDSLATQMQYEIHRAVLVGDGRSGSSPDKINSFSSVARATTDAFVTVTTRDAVNYQLIQQLRGLVDDINNEDGEDIFLFMSKADITAVMEYQHTSTGSIRYDSIEDLARQIGVAKIIPTSLCSSGSGNTQAIAFCPSKYVVIGEENVALNTWKDWDYNQTGYIMERFCAGAPEALAMGAVLLGA